MIARDVMDSTIQTSDDSEVLFVVRATEVADMVHSVLGPDHRVPDLYHMLDLVLDAPEAFAVSIVLHHIRM